MSRYNGRALKAAVLNLFASEAPLSTTLFKALHPQWICMTRLFFLTHNFYFKARKMYILYKMPIEVYDFINLHDISGSRNHTFRIRVLPYIHVLSDGNLVQREKNNKSVVEGVN